MCVCVAVPNEINEDRLCHDHSLQRDEWPWIGETSITSNVQSLNARRSTSYSTWRPRAYLWRPRGCFSVYYHTECVSLKARCATLKGSMCIINIVILLYTIMNASKINVSGTNIISFRGLRPPEPHIYARAPAIASLCICVFLFVLRIAPCKPIENMHRR